MLYGENISRVVPEINGSEIIIEKVHKVDSPNYLFIDLKLKNNVPQTFVIEFFYRGKKVFTRDYELKRREASFNREKFLDASDVIYLIMPDRFANGDISNDDVDGLIEKSNRKNKDGRHGGDLQGVIDNLRLYRFGEPLFNPELPSILHSIKTLQKPKVLSISLSTNGQHRNLSILEPFSAFRTQVDESGDLLLNGSIIAEGWSKRFE